MRLAGSASNENCLKLIRFLHRSISSSASSKRLATTHRAGPINVLRISRRSSGKASGTHPFRAGALLFCPSMAPRTSRGDHPPQKLKEPAKQTSHIEKQGGPSESQPGPSGVIKPRRSTRIAELSRDAASAAQPDSSSTALKKGSAKEAKSLQPPQNFKSVNTGKQPKDSRAESRTRKGTRIKKAAKVKTRERPRAKAPTKRKAPERRSTRVGREVPQAEDTTEGKYVTTSKPTKLAGEASGPKTKSTPQAPPPAVSQDRRHPSALTADSAKRPVTSRLSGAALRQLRRETQHDPLPQAILEVITTSSA